MASPYSGPETASTTRLGRPPFKTGRDHFRDEDGQIIDDQVRVAVRALLDDLGCRRAPPPIPQDDRDDEARRLLAAYYRRLWAHARDLQDPTWWQRHAPHDENEDT